MIITNGDIDWVMMQLRALLVTTKNSNKFPQDLYDSIIAEVKK